MTGIKEPHVELKQATDGGGGEQRVEANPCSAAAAAAAAQLVTGRTDENAEGVVALDERE